MTIKHSCKYLLCAIALFFIAVKTSAQEGPLKVLDPQKLQQVQQKYDSQGRAIPNSTTTTTRQDSLQRRDSNKDSITIYFRYFDSSRIRYFDSSISNFRNWYPVPAEMIDLGNFGTAARSLLFRPILKPGWDAGFHAFDIYRFSIDQTRFYQTTRPYTDLGYMLGSKSEQMFNILHTQNIKPNFNMAIQYRFISSPGGLKSQNTNHNNWRINGHYQSNNKRYNIYGIFINNKLKSSENGGVENDSSLNIGGLTDPFLIATRLGEGGERRNFFSTAVNTGNIYRENILLLRQQYDLGQKDSLVINDSTVIRLFYPRFRFQHNFTYSEQNYSFQDFATRTTKQDDYLRFFGRVLASDSVLYNDTWHNIENDFSIISFPEKNNLNQYLKAGVGLQNLIARFDTIGKSYYNIFLTGEYRNRTRNQKWEILANGKLYLAGLNSGDYSVSLNLNRQIDKLGRVQVGFDNVNRSPSFIYRNQSHFPLVSPTNLNKENYTKLSGSVVNDAKGYSLNAAYYLVSNFTYSDSFFNAKQEATLFNVLHISAEKKFRLRKFVNLYSAVHLQQTAGNPPVNLPLLFSINRLAFEGNFYKNLFLSTGLELNYHTPYKADNYSPFTGQFFFQDSRQISNRPEVNAYFNFRIKSFKAFIRAENLNTLGNNTGKIAFTSYNFSAPHYPQRGFWFRLGIWWTFVN